MVKNDVSFLIGGDAGQGVESSGAGFANAFARGGLHIFGMQDYHSRIRGGHNFYQIRVNERRVFSHTEAVHLVLALTEETIPKHKEFLVPGGGIICDADVEVTNKELEKEDIRLFPVPFGSFILLRSTLSTSPFSHWLISFKFSTERGFTLPLISR